MVYVAPVPKWKIGCLYAFLGCVAFGAVGSWLFPNPPSAPRPPRSVTAQAPAPEPAPDPVPPKVLSLNEKIAAAIGKCNRENVTELVVTDAANYVSVKFPVNDNLTTSFVIGGAKMDTIDILEVISKERPGYSVSVEGTFSMVDKFGNSEEKTVFSCTYSGITISQINFPNMLTDNAWAIADSADIHPAFR